MADLEINDEGLRVIYEEIAAKIRQVDEALRAMPLLGRPVSEIKTQAKAALANIASNYPTRS